jgi:hypothetical protein
LCICTGLKEKAADPFASLPDAATMEEVLRAVATDVGYTEERWRKHAKLLGEKEIDTVYQLRALSRERIEALDLPPVMTEYLLRVKAGEDQ